jgi:hypothetical protein
MLDRLLGGMRFGDDVAGFGIADSSKVCAVVCAFRRGLFRSGLVCLATLSHKVRSSSLKPRLRRGGAGISGIRVGGGFIG